MIRVSVIIPVFNVLDYFDKCVLSIVNQTLTDIEIILVDDGSSDGSGHKCDEWAAKDPRVRVVHKQNEGQSIARNTGLYIATGEYVAFVDADDYIEPNTYEEMYWRCKANQLDMAYFTYDRVDEKGHRVFNPNLNRVTELFSSPQEVSYLFLNLVGRTPQDYHYPSYTTSASMSLYKRSIIEKHNIRFVNVREIASEDLIFSLNFLLYAKNAACYPDVFYHYLVNTSSTTTTYNDKKYERMFRCLQEVESICKENYNEETYLPHFLSQILRIYKITMKYEAISNNPLRRRIQRIKEKCGSPWLKILYKSPFTSMYSVRERFYIKCMQYRLWPILMLIYRR